MKRKEALHYTGPSVKNANHTSLYEAKSCTHIYTQRRGKGLCQRINSGTRVRGSSPLTLNQELCRPQLENACKGRAWTTDTTANRSDKECKAGACVFYEARDFFFFFLMAIQWTSQKHDTCKPFYTAYISDGCKVWSYVYSDNRLIH